MVSCSEYGKVLKDGTLDEKYNYAVRAYKKKDYVRALPLFEELLSAYRGQPKSEEIYYYYCYSHFGMGQFELAAYHFKNFTENYFLSKRVEECAFMHAKSLYKESLPYFLEQSNTEKAIAEMQVFLNMYPESSYKNEGNEIIVELRKVLQKKSFENAYLYFKIEDYRAAILSFKNTIKFYPDVENRDEIEFLIVKSAYLYAKNSVDEEKITRYEMVFKYFNEYYKKNTKSAFYEQAKLLNKKAEEELIKHKKSIKIQ